MQRIAGIPSEPPERRGMSGDPAGMPLDLPGRPWDPRHPGDAPRTPWGPPVIPMYHKNKQIATNLQRQKHSNAASESFHCNASPQWLPWAVLCCMRRQRSPFWSATGPN